MPAKKNAAPAAAPAIALITSVKDIMKACQTIHTTGQTLQTLMHQTACSVLSHYGKNKDTRVVLALINALPESVRKNSLIAWFNAFGQMTITEQEGLYTVTYEKDKKTKLGDAMAKPFWKFVAKEGVAYEALDLDNYVKQQVARLEKDAKETKRDHTALIMALKGYTAASSVREMADAGATH